MAKRILIIDNEPDLLEVLKDALSTEGIEAITLTHTNDIFSTLEKYKPDLLLIDYILDRINGGEICHQVKNCKLTNRLPVIIMSSYSKVFKSLGYYGCDEFIAKPFELDDLIKCVYEHTHETEKLHFSKDNYV